MNNALLKQLLTEYEQKRNQAIEAAEERKRSLLEVNPKISEIDKELSKISIEASRNIISASPTEKEKILSDLKKKSNSLIKEKNAIIKELFQSTDYFEPKFECKTCKDTGFIQKNGKSEICSCLKQKIYDIAYNKSNMGNLEFENFGTFNIRMFSDKENKEKYKSDISPRENMNLLKEKANNFIQNFDDPQEKNLIFLGGTGLGKTFLTNCIANELLKEGKTVLYQTAPVMFDDIFDEKYGKTQNQVNLEKEILTVDLLIIDDLGTEKVSDNKIEELFNIINTRLLNQNHKITKTIISSNLTAQELANTYTMRIGSRLAGSYRFLRFFGDDIRLKRSKKETD
ncbi:MAG: ATP-binding protein [Clostridia bacterium]|nr:ATP-binding protein [Clostridia bacterium]